MSPTSLQEEAGSSSSSSLDHSVAGPRRVVGATKKSWAVRRVLTEFVVYFFTALFSSDSAEKIAFEDLILS